MCLACGAVSRAVAAVDDGATPPPAMRPSEYALHVDAQWQYDDNVYRLPQGVDLSSLLGPGTSVSDHTVTGQLGADGHWVFGKQSLDFALQAARNKYSLNTELDNTQASAQAIFNLQFTRLLSVEAGETYSRALANFAYTGTSIKDLISSSESFVAGRLQPGPRWIVFGGLRYGETRHSADQLASDDFSRRSGNVGVQYALTATDWIGGEYRYTDGRFKIDEITEIGGLPFRRDYQEYTERLLLKSSLGTRLLLDFDAGYLNRRYPDSLVGAFSGNTFRATARWDASAKTQVVLAGYKELRAYVEAESNYFVARGVSITPVWSVTERIALRGQCSYEGQRFVGSDPTASASQTRHDTLRSQQISLVYSPRERLSLLLSFQHSDRGSTLAPFVFSDRLFMVSISTKPWLH